MAFLFRYQGGVFHPSEHVTEKFMLFFIMNGKEWNFYELLRNGLITSDLTKTKEGFSKLSPRLTNDTDFQAVATNHSFVSPFQFCKLFIHRSGFGIPKQTLMKYFHLYDAGGIDARIIPFSKGESEHFFQSKHCEIISGEGLKDIRALLHDKQTRDNFDRSLKYSQENPLPTALLKGMVTIKEDDLLPEYGRKLRIGG